MNHLSTEDQTWVIACIEELRKDIMKIWQRKHNEIAMGEKPASAPFADNPLLQAERAAFDNPTIRNLDALIYVAQSVMNGAPVNKGEVKCKTPFCETTMSEGSPEYCPICQEKDRNELSTKVAQARKHRMALSIALRDCLSCFNDVLNANVTEERVETWQKVLDEHGQLDHEQGIKP